MREEDLYELATEELNSRNRKPELWARACALATDDVDEARYLYTNLRVEELAAEHNIDLSATASVPSQPGEFTLLDDNPGAPASPISKLHEDSDTLSSDNFNAEFIDKDDTAATLLDDAMTPAQQALQRARKSAQSDEPSEAAGELPDLEAFEAFPDSPVETASASDELSLMDIDSDNRNGNSDHQSHAAATQNPEQNWQESEAKSPTANELLLGDLTSDLSQMDENTIHIDAADSDVATLVDKEDGLWEGSDENSSPSETLSLAGSDDTAGTDLPLTIETDGNSQSEQTVALDMPEWNASDNPESSQGDAQADSLIEGHEVVLTDGPGSDETDLPSDLQNHLPKDSLNESQNESQNDSHGLTDLDAGVAAAAASAAGALAMSATGSAQGESDHQIERQSQELKIDSAMTTVEDETGSSDAIKKIGRFAIFQNNAGLVKASAQGTNVKAMLLTLPWLLTKRLWGASFVYLIMSLVLLAALLLMWPRVLAGTPTTADLLVTGAFTLLAIFGWLIVPFTRANSWYQDSLISKGYRLCSSSNDDTGEVAEQRFLISQQIDEKTAR